MVLENKILVKVVESSYMAWRWINSSKTLLGKITVQSLIVLVQERKLLKKFVEKLYFQVKYNFWQGNTSKPIITQI